MKKKEVTKNEKQKIKNDDFINQKKDIQVSKGLSERMSMGKFEFVEDKGQRKRR